ncbi:tail fiber protein [Mycobacterium phage jiawei]|nr:tail fiber protein [Mycobacterium phage jiawei]
MTLKTKVAYPVSGDQREFDVPFEYLDAGHVRASVSGIAVAYEWVSPTRIRLLDRQVDGVTLLIQRITPTTPLVTFVNGAVLTEEDLNKAVRQTLFIQQELVEAYEDGIGQAKVRLGENLGIGVDPSQIIDELVGMALADEVLEEFRRRIADIDLNAQSIIQQTLRTDALQLAVDALGSLEDGTGIATVIAQEKQERIEGDTALAETLSLIGAKSADSLAYILDTNKVRVSPTESLGARLSSIGSQFGAQLALIQQEATTRANALQSVTQTLNTQGSRLGQAESGITSLGQTISTGLAAEAQARQQLAAKIAGDISAAVQTEANARVSADSAFANTLALLGAKTADGSAWALDETRVKVAGGVSLGNRLSGLDTRIGNAEASVVSEFNARVTAVSSLSQRVDGVVSTLNGQTTSITLLQEAFNGIGGRAGLVINANGHITGWRLNNDGRSGSFVVAAENFGIVSAYGTVQPFSYDAVNGVLTLNTARLTGSISINGRFMVSPDGTVTMKSAATGERMELTSRLLKVFDANNVLRVELGLFD